MDIKNFWYSYKSILINALEKDFFHFFKKIFGALYKFIIRFFKHQFSLGITNLDNLEESNFQLSLDKLFQKFNSDKGSNFKVNQKKIPSHNYSIFYEKYFSMYKKKTIHILELGSHEGRGIASFYFFFPNAKIVGANINPFQMKFKSKRIDELYIDVSSKKIINNFSNHIHENFDIIIDDASHNLKDILITFSKLFQKLKKGGFYVIEDINQFHVFKELNPYKNELTPKEILQNIKYNKDFKSSFISEEEKKYLVDNIAKIDFEKGQMVINNSNVSDIVFIKKKNLL